MPTIPPAGPDRIASFPWNAAPSASPPLDCMNSGRTLSPSAVFRHAMYRRNRGERYASATLVSPRPISRIDGAT